MYFVSIGCHKVLSPNENKSIEHGIPAIFKWISEYFQFVINEILRQKKLFFPQSVIIWLTYIEHIEILIQTVIQSE